MRRILISEDDRVVPWVGSRVEEDQFGQCSSIGLEENGDLIAGVVYNMYTGISVSMHVAAVPTRRWLDRCFLYICFITPFKYMSCNRVTGLVRSDNALSIRFVEKLGFKKEGEMRQACDDGSNLMIYGMLKNECKYLEI